MFWCPMRPRAARRLMLGLGRALGETMAVTFVIGNSHHLSASLFAAGTTISASLANEFTEAESDLYQSSFLELGLILFVLTFVVLAAARFMLAQSRTQGENMTPEPSILMRGGASPSISRSAWLGSRRRSAWRCSPSFCRVAAARRSLLRLELFLESTLPPGAQGGLLNPIIGSLAMTGIAIVCRNADRRCGRNLARGIRAGASSGGRDPLPERHPVERRRRSSSDCSSTELR